MKVAQYLRTIFVYLFIRDVYTKHVLHCCRDVDSCITIQEEIRKCLKFIKNIFKNKDFVHHVRDDSLEIKDMEEKIDQNIRDLERTDCSIVFAGKFIIVNDKNMYKLYYCRRKNIQSIIFKLS